MTALRHYTQQYEEEGIKKNAYHIHASLAGGRKTMSYYLGQAMNLFGRKQDRLSHVLLKPEYEYQVGNFYYPFQPEALRDKKGEPLSLTADDDTIITLSEFPVINLQSSINIHRFKSSNLHFNQILYAIDDEQNGVMHPIDLSVVKKYNKGRLKMRFGWDTVEIEPQNLAVLLWLAWRDWTSPQNATVNLSTSNGQTMNRYYRELKAVEYYVRNGDETQITWEDILGGPSHTSSQQQKDHIRPKISTTVSTLGLVSSVYSIQSKRSHYWLSRKAFKPEDLRKLDVFMVRMELREKHFTGQEFA